MQRKTQAIVFPEKQRAELIEIEVPEPTASQVMVETTVGLISAGTERFCFRGEFDAGTTWDGWVKYPFNPGYSAVGNVVRVGAGVTHLAEGDPVFAGGKHHGCVVVEADHAIKLPAGLDHDDASWSALAVIAQTAVRRAEHAMGDTAVVIGLGPVGQLITQYLRAIGLWRVLAVDRVAARLDAAERHGATDVFRGGAEDAGDFVAGHTGGRLADVVYDVTGHHAVLPMALKLARDFGRLMLLGDSPHPSRQHLTQDVLARQVSIVGSHIWKLQPEHAWWARHRQIQLFHAYLQRGQMRVGDLVTHRFEPARAHEVYAKLLDDAGCIGALFDWRRS